MACSALSLFLSLLSLLFLLPGAPACHPKRGAHGYYCECSPALGCDAVPEVPALDAAHFALIQTSRGTSGQGQAIHGGIIQGRIIQGGITHGGIIHGGTQGTQSNTFGSRASGHGAAKQEEGHGRTTVR